MDFTRQFGLPVETDMDEPGVTLRGTDLVLPLADVVERRLVQMQQQIHRPEAQADFQPGFYTALSGSGNPWGAGELVTGGDYVDCAVVAVAGPEGRLIIHFAACLGKAGTANSTCRIQPEVRVGSTIGAGTVISTPVGDSGAEFIGITAHAANDSSTARIAMGRTMQVDGLTPGQAYNVRLLHRATGNPGDDGGIDRRSLVVEPR